MAPGQPVAPPLPEPSSTSEPSAASGEPVIVKGPDGTTWEASSSKKQEAYQADIEDCYRYASAKTRSDAQFNDDRNAGIETLNNRTPYAGLRQRVDDYDLRNRRRPLMPSCQEQSWDNVLGGEGYGRTC